MRPWISKILLAIILVGLAIWAGVWLGDHHSPGPAIDVQISREAKEFQYKWEGDDTPWYVGGEEGSEVRMAIRDDTLRTEGDTGLVPSMHGFTEYVDVEVAPLEVNTRGYPILAIDNVGDYAPLQVDKEGRLKVRISEDEDALPVKVVN